MDYTGAFLLFAVGVTSVLLFRDTVPKSFSIIAVVGYTIFSILAWHIGDHGMFLVAILLGGAHALFRVLDVLIGKAIEHSATDVTLTREKQDKLKKHTVGKTDLESLNWWYWWHKR